MRINLLNASDVPSIINFEFDSSGIVRLQWDCQYMTKDADYVSPESLYFGVILGVKVKLM